MLLADGDEIELGKFELCPVLKPLTDCGPLCHHQVVHTLQVALQFFVLKGKECQPSRRLCSCHQLDHS